MLTAMVLILFSSAMLFERMTVLKQEGKKVKILHFCIMLVSFCVLMLYSFSVLLPSPTDAISNVIESIFKLKG